MERSLFKRLQKNGLVTNLRLPKPTSKINNPLKNEI